MLVPLMNHVFMKHQKLFWTSLRICLEFVSFSIENLVNNGLQNSRTPGYILFHFMSFQLRIT